MYSGSFIIKEQVLPGAAFTPCEFVNTKNLLERKLVRFFHSESDHLPHILSSIQSCNRENLHPFFTNLQHLRTNLEMNIFG
ncbi:MAG: hypothetical protein GF308_11655 [Candidatus Heimdallarchaeota archaeon]|nr:hypothetical protein [Candidatus Heimdallarchaeota archaeon]